MLDELFSHYQNPIRARGVFNAYVPHPSQLKPEQLDDVLRIVAENNSPDDLDLALDGFLTGHSLPNLGGGSPYSKADPDSNGGLANAITALEDWGE